MSNDPARRRNRPDGRAGPLLASTLIEAMLQSVIVTDRLGRARQVNERWLTLSGQRRAAATGPDWLGTQAPEDSLRAAHAWQQALQDSQPFSATYALSAADSSVNVQWHHEPLREGGAVTGWLCTGEPIPDAPALLETASQEATLERLALNLKGLRDALTHLPLGALIVDAQTHRIRLVNPQAQRLLGVTLAPGMTLSALSDVRLGASGSPLTVDRLPLRRALSGQRAGPEELDIQRPDGSRAQLRLSASPVPGPHGPISAAIMTLEEVVAEGAGAYGPLSSDMRRAQEAVTLHGGEPVTPGRFLTLMGELHEQMGFPSLEGRLIALLLLRAEPVSLGEAASVLNVSKVAVSKVSTVMQGRGDLQVIRSFSSREHLLALTDHNYVHDLSVRRVASWAISILCESLLDTNHLDAATTRQIRTHLETHTRVAVALERVLSPIEKRQASALATHLRENWDAVPAPAGRSDTDAGQPD